MVWCYHVMRLNVVWSTYACIGGVGGGLCERVCHRDEDEALRPTVAQVCLCVSVRMCVCVCVCA